MLSVRFKVRAFPQYQIVGPPVLQLEIYAGSFSRVESFEFVDLFGAEKDKCTGMHVSLEDSYGYTRIHLPLRGSCPKKIYLNLELKYLAF